MTNVTLPAELVNEIMRAEASGSELLAESDGRTIVQRMLAGASGLFQLLDPFLRGRRDPKVLEVGSGNGLHLCDLLTRGIDAYGIEPGEAPFAGRFARARQLLLANGVADAETRLRAAFAEKLPFADATFDIVASTAVMEHVSDVEAAFSEAVRVVRPGGRVVLQMPNYDSFYEGHYRFLWLPYVLRTKAAARWYVGNVRGRPVEFLEHLNFTSPRWLQSLAAGNADVSATETFFTSFSKLTYIPALHRALALGLDEKLGRFAPLAHGRLRNAMGGVASLATRGLAAAGLAPEFTIVCHRRAASA